MIDGLFSQEASFSIKYTIDHPRFQLNVPSNLWYIACIFQIWSALVGYEELTGELEPIRECEIFGMILFLLDGSLILKSPFSGIDESSECVLILLKLTLYFFLLLDAHRASGDHEQAINNWKTETLPVYKDELGDHPWTASILRYIGSSYRCLAQSESADSGMADQAELYIREALELRIRLLGEHQDTARSHVDLSDIFIVKKDFRSAMEQLKEAIEIQEKVLGEEHETTKNTLTELRRIQSMVK